MLQYLFTILFCLNNEKIIAQYNYSSCNEDYKKQNPVGSCKFLHPPRYPGSKPPCLRYIIRL